MKTALNLATSLLLCLASFPAMGQQAMPPPPPALAAPSASSSVEGTNAKLLPAGTEVEYRGGRLPPGTLLVEGAAQPQRSAGLYLLLGGLAVQGLAGLTTLGMGIYFLATSAPGAVGGVAATLAFAATPLVILPYLGPLVVGLALRTTWPLISLLCLAVLGAEVVGTVLWATSGRRMVRYQTDAPAYPMPEMRSGAVPAMPEEMVVLARF